MNVFFVGWHQPCNGDSGCQRFEYCMISVNRLVNRRSPFPVQNWILDSGAFSRIAGQKTHLLKKYGKHIRSGHLSIKQYAKEVMRWKGNGNMMAAATQDFICSAFVLEKTGLDIPTHQKLTIHRYDRLVDEITKLCIKDKYTLLKVHLDYCSEDIEIPYIMPVLQGYAPEDYMNHIRMYGDRLKAGMWVGVGSICARNSHPSQILNILLAIKSERPDLRLHGFGLKKNALKSGEIWDLLHSADSQAHGFDAVEQKFPGSKNCPIKAEQYSQSIMNQSRQISIWKEIYV